MDMMMMWGGAEDYIADLQSCITTGEVAMDRIDDAVKRILAVKMAMGVVKIVNKNSPPAPKETKEFKATDPVQAGQAAL